MKSRVITWFEKQRGALGLWEAEARSERKDYKGKETITCELATYP